MSISNFRKQLANSPISKGAAWVRADFHVHVPGSSDYEYRQEDAASNLGREMSEKGYRFAIMLKHQEFPTRAELAALQEHCPNTTLVPGAEINVFVDALSKKIGKDYFFHCIVAVDPNIEGDFNYVLQKAKDELSYRPGEYPAGFLSNILDVGRFFRKNGALFIPAHLHQSKSPEHSRSIDDVYDDDSFLGFVEAGAFDCLEVRSPSTAKFFSGSQLTTDGRSIPRIVCVASTDAHHHEHIVQRNRGTWIRSENCNFNELKAALSFPHRVKLDKPELSHARIEGIHVRGSYIQDVWMPLNEGLNALIGSKGSGKTALVECIRFALNTHVPADRRESVSRHINHILGSAGYVECLVIGRDGSELLITRRADSPDRISITESNGEVRHVGTTEELPFPISILGWHEIEAVADQAEARISLLDRIGDPQRIQTLYAEIDASVEKARDSLPFLQRAIRKLETSLKEMWLLHRKRSTLQRLEQGDLLTLQQKYEWFLGTEQKIAGLRNSVLERHAAISERVSSHIGAEVTSPADESPDQLKEAILSVQRVLSENQTVEADATSMLQNKLNSILGVLDQAATVLTGSFAIFRDDEYTPKVNALPQEDREILARQIQVLEETKRLPLLEQQSANLLEEVQANARQIAELCANIGKTRNAIIGTRQDWVGSLNSDLTNVRLKFLPSANRDRHEAFQRGLGEGARDFIGFVGGFGKATSYENLEEVFRKVAALTLQESTWDVNSTLLDAKFADFFRVIDDDDLEIELNVGVAGFVPIQNLSAGQRCVAVFPLLLRNTKGPLIIDQPEDNLDNRYIADIIGPDLLEKKENQQFLVTSHNANLVVLTDADLIVHVDSDGAQASLPSAGFLSCSSSAVRKSVVDVLDGGEIALNARQKKYGAQMRPDQG
jgi:hypothetical protein